ncbi:hypothetical protein BC941DRAFT_350285 [Chlamydoabsidia padenii]|nr:hypothetical protein BC941DRAFT_350285 [Chlamydoabsidia padenii]
MTCTTILSLPTELLDRILLFGDVWQLAILRQVCSHWRSLIDKPYHWRKVCLLDHHHGSDTINPPLESTIVNTWSLTNFQYLMNPHLAYLKSLTISGVRDSTVRLILDQCHMLEELEVVSFNTLSDHALTLNQHSKLRRCVISGGKDPFFSIDALSLARFICHCPSLTQLSIEHCLLCIQPDIFLAQLEKGYYSNDNTHGLNALDSLTLVHLQRPWSSHHVNRLLQSCPNLKHIQLE